MNASIVMVDAVHRAQAAMDPDDLRGRREAMLDAVVERLRPILVTSITTMVGVFPTAYGLGGYDHQISPMSLALGWGLAISTVVTLFLVPVLYTLAGDVRAVGARLAGRLSRGAGSVSGPSVSRSSPAEPRSP